MKNAAFFAALLAPVMLIACGEQTAQTGEQAGQQTLPSPPAPEEIAPETATDGETPAVGMPNPASVYCIDKGGEVEIRTGEDGGQSGWCHLPDGRVVEEWELFRSEQAPNPDAETPANETPAAPAQ